MGLNLKAVTLQGWTVALKESSSSLFFSTGFLVRDFLTKADTIESYATEVSSHKDGYNGFNLTLLELG